MQKKIAILIGSLSGGGAERVVSNLSLHLNEKIERSVIIYSCEDIIYPYKGELIRLKPCTRGEVKGWFRKLYFLYKYVNAVRNIKQKYKIQVCVSFLSVPNLINIFSGCGEKRVISVRGYNSKKIKGFYGKAYALLIRLFYNSADLIVAVSQGVKIDLIKNYNIDGKKIKVIYNPYDVEKIQKLMNENLHDRYKPIFENQVIISVGRLTHIKGQQNLIRAFSKVKIQNKKAKLVLLGEGELEDELRAITKKLNLGDDIYFLGFQGNPFQFIYNSSIFVLPSLTEGFPNALVEAMACGIPVISTDCKAGPREILAPDSDCDQEIKTVEYASYGILVPVCDGNGHDAVNPLTPQENVLADSIIELLENQDLKEKYSLMAKERANDFKIDKIIPHWEDVILQNWSH